MAQEKTARADALLVGYENQENLGVRSIVAYLAAQGYRVELVPFFPEHHDWVLAAIRQHQPRLVGFSVVYQYTLDEFGKLLRHLRAGDVTVHFTAGGHFPSLRPEQTLELLPELDSVIRFEGEVPLHELLERLDQPGQWGQIRNLAFREGARAVLNPLGPLLADLDSLPPVYRDEPRQIGHGIRMAALAASRGCLFNCSFCSIRQFYGHSFGPLRRVRSPQNVVEEMLALSTHKQVCFFSFQDDDFAARTASQRRWLTTFLQELERTGLARWIRWKISCRVDDLEPESLEAMRNHGLIAVYLGVESGSPAGLRTLNKRVNVAQNLAAVNLLKQYDLAMAIGFMLFDPSTTVETIRENLDFLKAVGRDGYFPVNFCKMLPYAGTPIETQLRQEGRLRGTVTQPDYEFLDPQLNEYEYLVRRIFERRNFRADGLVALLVQADFELRLNGAFGHPEPAEGYGQTLRRIIRESNRVALETLEALLDKVITHGTEFLQEEEALADIAERQWRGDMMAEIELTKSDMVLPAQP